MTKRTSAARKRKYVYVPTFFRMPAQINEYGSMVQHGKDIDSFKTLAQAKAKLKLHGSDADPNASYIRVRLP